FLRPIPGQRLHTHAEGARAIARSAALFAFGTTRLPLRDLHVERLVLAVTYHGQLGRGPRRHLREIVAKAVGVLDRGTVDRGDHVAAFDAGLVRRAAGLHRVHQRASDVR